MEATTGLLIGTVRLVLVKCIRKNALRCKYATSDCFICSVAQLLLFSECLLIRVPEFAGFACAQKELSKFVLHGSKTGPDILSNQRKTQNSKTILN